MSIRQPVWKKDRGSIMLPETSSQTVGFGGRLHQAAHPDRGLVHCPDSRTSLSVADLNLKWSEIRELPCRNIQGAE